MIIKPISDLRNNFTDISKIVHEQNQPVFLTKNGSGDMVVMSLAKYNEHIAKLELYDSLARAEADSASGRTISWEDSKNAINAMLKTKV